MSTSKSGLDRYSAGVPLAVLLIIFLDVFNVFPVIYSPKWTLLIVFIIIVGFLRTQDPRSILRRGFSRLRPKLATRKVDLRQVGISGFGLALCIYLYLPGARAALRSYKNVDVIFVALGGMIGTIIALAFSLSIIPIQRAIETFTPSVARLYRNDKVSRRIFVFLGLFCLTSFLCSVDRVFFGIKNWVLLPIGILMTAVSLDLVRLHYRRVAQLLEPDEAIQSLLREVTDFIDRTQRTIAREAALRWQLLPDDQKASTSPRHIEAAFYGQSTAFVQDINARSGELAEIATKAIARGEPFSAERAIHALVEIVRHYSTARRDNLVIHADPETLFSVYDSDLRGVVNPIYEHLQDINRSAIGLNAENVCIYVIRALAAAAVLNLTLHSKEPTNLAALLAWRPLSYLQGCVRESQRAGMSNAAFQANDILLSVANSKPANAEGVSSIQTVIETWKDVCSAYLKANESVLANETLKTLCLFLHLLVERNEPDLWLTIKGILDYFHSITPQLLAREDRSINQFAPYNLTVEGSIGHLVARTQSLIKREEEWVSPYGTFVQVNEVIAMHLRSQADTWDLGQSFLLWHMIQTIEFIAKVYIGVLGEADMNDRRTKEVADQLRWYLSALWAAFQRATKIDSMRAYEACDKLAVLAMRFHQAGHPKVTSAAVGCISSIAKSYSEDQSMDPYGLESLLFKLWIIRVFAVSKADHGLRVEADLAILNAKTVSENTWEIVVSRLEGAKAELETDFWRPSELPLYDSAEAVLKRLLKHEFPKES